MKSLNVITSIIPILTTLQGAGIFSNPASVLADSWSKQLTAAAIADGLDMSDTASHLSAMAAATDFETQQDEMATSLAMLNQLLDDVPTGNVPVYIAPPEGFNTVRVRLSQSISDIIDIFRPDQAKLEQMRLDASMLSTLSQGEDQSDAEDAPNIVNAAGLIHDYIERSVTAPFNHRQDLLSAAKTTIERIAA